METLSRSAILSDATRAAVDLEVRASPRPTLTATFPDGRRIAADGEDLFGALLNLRRQLDRDGIRIGVAGALARVWPSGMSSQMSNGRIAYLFNDDRIPISTIDVLGPVDPAEVVSGAEHVGRPLRLRPTTATGGNPITPPGPEMSVVGREARRHPNGWVYEIVGVRDPMGEVPPERIRGAWKVGPEGTLTGEYRANPNYRTHKSPDH